MPRTKKNRVIRIAPVFCGYKPIGTSCKKGTEVLINFEEYEALNLCDYELLTQAEAAEMMHISRPTFTRIYESVRRKIAAAFIEGKCIRFEGGNFDMENWYRCESCRITFTVAGSSPAVCPFCKKEVLH